MMLWRNLELQCRDVFKEAVCVCSHVYYCWKSGLYLISSCKTDINIHHRATNLVLYWKSKHTNLDQKPLCQIYPKLKLMKNDCHLFKWVFRNVDVSKNWHWYWHSQHMFNVWVCGEDRGKGGCVGANISKLSPAQPSVLSLAWLAPWIIAPPPPLYLVVSIFSILRRHTMAILPG